MKVDGSEDGGRATAVSGCALGAGVAVSVRMK